MMEEMTTIAELAYDDLVVASNNLYVAAVRYVRAFERDEIDRTQDENAIPVGVAAGYLTMAAAKRQEAYARCDETGFFEEHEDEA